MKALILAAGRGSRMREKTDDRPKALVELNGKPLLEWQIDALRHAEISDISLITGYKSESFAPYGLPSFHNAHWETTNMVSSLTCADTLLSKEPCIISYSDIFYESAAVISLMEASEDIAITYDPHWLSLWKKRFDNPLDDAETFKIDQTYKLLEIGNTPASVDDIQGQYMGLLKFTPTGWRHFHDIWLALDDEARARAHMTGMLQKVIEDGHMDIRAIPYENEWGEVDNITDLGVYAQS
ncbi:MAG: phosphocholine cytidylyltransferase family protein [Alphaproteobacteria bacterium]|nr:phosphocholine cytidylyltransferase family protein [Alphaproteobacteria bacterium]